MEGGGKEEERKGKGRMAGRKEGRKEGKKEGRKEEWAKDNETHKTPTPLPDNNFIIIINTFH